MQPNLTQNTTHSPQQTLLAVLGLIALLAAPAPALAEIYRVIDADGNISFTDKPPVTNQGGSSEAVSIDASTQNTSLSRDAIKQEQPEWLLDAQQQRREQEAAKRAAQPSKTQVKDWKKSLRDAKQALRDAERARELGVIAAEGDYIGKAGGGVRPSQQYFQKFRALEQNVLDAQKKIDALKKAGPG